MKRAYWLLAVLVLGWGGASALTPGPSPVSTTGEGSTFPPSPVASARTGREAVAVSEGVGGEGQSPGPLQDVGFDQRLDQPLPLDLVFQDEEGQAVRLGDYFGRRPVLLTLNYFHCPNLCPLILDGLTNSLTDLPFTIGDEYSVITVSIDPQETPELAIRKKSFYLRRYTRPGAWDGWHFLTGDAAAIQSLTQAVGFRYGFDGGQNEYAHPTGLVVLTPQGRIARYLYGMDYPARDLRLALIEAAQNQIGSAVDQVLLLCYHYDPATGRYSTIAMNLMRIGGGLTIGILGMFLAVLWRRDARRRSVGLRTAPQEPGEVG